MKVENKQKNKTKKTCQILVFGRQIIDVPDDDPFVHPDNYPEFPRPNTFESGMRRSIWPEINHRPVHHKLANLMAWFAAQNGQVTRRGIWRYVHECIHIIGVIFMPSNQILLGSLDEKGLVAYIQYHASIIVGQRSETAVAAR